ncbi:OsmC family protein [Streptomyces sp. NBC_01451]|uniref:OsmC family protein n=1 Tax=Streptomyces sp. NBC_01451 TaxID=2903872 RepID=UPI002E3615F7|nr:OsmC family protein [Streptomyces sp. NBC_01451]
MNTKSSARDAGIPRPAQTIAEPPGQIQVTHVADQAYAVFVRGHELTVDQPVEAGGDDDGPTPVELFVVSLATCVAYYAGRFLQRHQLPYDQLQVRTEYDMADDRPARVAAVRLRILLPVRLSHARQEALRAVVDHCTVHNTLRMPPEITVEVD